MRFEKDSYAIRITKAICQTGELPYRRMKIMPGKYRMYRRNVRNMVDKGYLNIIGVGEEKSIRMSKKLVDRIEELLGKEYYDLYMKNSRNHKFSGGRAKGHSVPEPTLRNHMVATPVLMLDRIGANIINNDIELLTYNMEASQDLELFSQQPLRYISSVDLKNTSVETRNKYAFTRVIGTLINGESAFLLYNTEAKPMKWSESGELKSVQMVREVVSHSFIGGDKAKVNQAIIFGDNFETLDKIVNNKDEGLLGNNIPFNKAYFVPNDDIGVIQLSLITLKNYEERSKRALFANRYQETDTPASAYLSDKDVFAFDFCGGDFVGLERFLNMVLEYKQESLVIYALSFQEPFVKKLLQDRGLDIKVVPVNVAEYYKKVRGGD